ncbi:MAG: enoyl-CoA hydratase [Actinobacteria bacterium]|nr:enoyl-CoA hydratase [Actinomycetota bacterium]
MSDTSFFSTTDVGYVRWLTMNRPTRMNAIPLAGWAALRDEFRDFRSAEQRVLVIAGAGDNFCAGADVSGDGTDMLFTSAAVGAQQMRPVGEAATELFEMPKPVIAMVDGVAAGAGLNLALGCDIVVASESVRMSAAFVLRGLTIDFGGTWLLPRIVGLARAKELALTGRIVDADEALRIGLVATVVPGDNLRSTVNELANTLAAGAPLAQRFIKQGLNRSMEWSFEQALAFETQSQAALLTSLDFAEGVRSFQDKRPPSFSGG